VAPSDSFEEWLEKQPPAYREAFEKGARKSPAEVARTLSDRIAEMKFQKPPSGGPKPPSGR
jgi:hypothetical protein